VSFIINPYRYSAGGYSPPSGAGAHRYWALSATTGFGFGGGNFFWNVNEVQFLDQDLNAITSGSAISTGTFGGFPASNAFDGNAGTLASLNANNAQAGTGLCYIGRDFGSAVTVYAGTLNSDSGSGGWQVIYSDDGTNWSNAHATQPNRGNDFVQLQASFNEPADVAPTSATHARMVILNIAADSHASSRVSAAEVEFLVGGADQATGGSTFHSTETAGTFPSTQAFDNNNSTLWVSAASNFNRPQYVGYAFGSGKSIDGFSYTHRGSAGSVDESPTDLVLQVGNSSTGPWTTIKWRSQLSGFSLGEKRTY
jgi:hypothetical protein